MVAKQIYDQIFFSLMSGVEDWEKSSIDDLLKKDGLLDEGDYSNDYDGGELTEVLLNLADIAPLPLPIRTERLLRYQGICMLLWVKRLLKKLFLKLGKRL